MVDLYEGSNLPCISGSTESYLRFHRVVSPVPQNRISGSTESYLRFHRVQKWSTIESKIVVEGVANAAQILESEMRGVKGVLSR
jgi:hypothetical protein